VKRIQRYLEGAIREKSVGDAALRKKMLLSAIGLWKDRADLPDPQTYIRNLRKGDRLKRISK